MTAPPACAAKRPVSNLNTLSPIFRSTDFGSGCMCLLLGKRAPMFSMLLFVGGEAPAHQFSVVSPLGDCMDTSGTGLRLITDQTGPLLTYWWTWVPVVSFLGAVLATEAQLGDDRAVALDVLAPQVVEKALAAPDHAEEATTGVVILRVGLEVLGELGDPLRQ